MAQVAAQEPVHSSVPLTGRLVAEAILEFLINTWWDEGERSPGDELVIERAPSASHGTEVWSVLTGELPWPQACVRLHQGGERLFRVSRRPDTIILTYMN